MGVKNNVLMHWTKSYSQKTNESQKGMLQKTLRLKSPKFDDSVAVNFVKTLLPRININD